ncbi:gasdermin-A [Aegotheles albertisi]
MFKRVTQSIVNQLDPSGDLVPVHSISDHEHFRPLCLVRRKRKTIFNPSPSYKQTWYCLEDVLLPAQSTEPLLSRESSQALKQFTVKESTTDRVDGSLSLCMDAVSTEVKGAASLSKGWTIKLEKSHVPVPKLAVLNKERKMNMNHSFIQQLRKTNQDLYVVHETIEASEGTSYEESSRAEGSFMAQLYAKFCAKGSRENKRSITIPQGCTLAFRAIQLNITDQLWGLSQGQLGVLEAEVKENCQILSALSSHLSTVFLQALKVVMRDRNLFQELNQKMEAVLDEPNSCELQTGSLELKGLLSTLENTPEHHLLELAGAITYILDALDELMEEQLLLLLESLEERIVSQQLKLVKSILQHNIEHRKGPFSLDTTWLCFTQEKEEKLTMMMVEMSGVRLQKDGSATCTGEAFSAVAALYVSLYVLDVLSSSE